MSEPAAAEPAAAPAPAADAKKKAVSKSKKAAAPKEPKAPTRTRPPRDTKKPDAPPPIPPQQRSTRPKAAPAPAAAPANPLKAPRNPIVAPIKLPKGKKGLSPGTIVWAKMPGFPWFPGTVADEKDKAVPSKVSAQKPDNALKDRVHLVRFTGDRNRVTWGWVPAALLQTFNESADADDKIIKNQRYKSQKERREVRTAHRKALAQLEEGGGEAGAKAKAALASKEDDDEKEDEEMDTTEDRPAEAANGDSKAAGSDKPAASDDKPAAASDDKPAASDDKAAGDKAEKANGDTKMDEDAPAPSSEKK